MNWRIYFRFLLQLGFWHFPSRREPFALQLGWRRQMHLTVHLWSLSRLLSPSLCAFSMLPPCQSILEELDIDRECLRSAQSLQDAIFPPNLSRHVANEKPPVLDYGTARKIGAREQLCLASEKCPDMNPGLRSPQGTLIRAQALSTHQSSADARRATSIIFRAQQNADIAEHSSPS